MAQRQALTARETALHGRPATPAVGGARRTGRRWGGERGRERGGGGRGRGGGRSFRAPKIRKINTNAAPPQELLDYMNQFKTEALGGLKTRLGEVREQGGAFMEEATRQGREERSARLEEARSRAEAAGIPFDERAAMRDIMKSEAGAKAGAQEAQERRVDDLTKSTVSAYTSGLGIIQSPSQAALAQKGQSLEEQRALMNYWLGQENAATNRFSAAASAQQGWMSMLASMLNSAYA